MTDASTAVLVVDDDARVRELVETALQRSGYAVVSAANGKAALERIESDDVSLVLLDLRLPDVDGLDLLDDIRAAANLPVIIMTARGSEGDRVMGLASGADDYVVKPFSTRELAARVEAVLRRQHPVEAKHYTFDELEIDISAREVTVAGDLVELTRKEFDVLALMAAEPRRAFSRQELLETVWRSSPEFQDDATVTEHVRRLRLKLGAGARHIATVRGIGYRLDP